MSNKIKKLNKDIRSSLKKKLLKRIDIEEERKKRIGLGQDLSREYEKQRSEARSK